MFKNNKIITALTLIIIFVCFVSSLAFAYTLTNLGYFAYPVCLNYEPMPQPYYGRMYNAVYNWNNTSCGHNLVKYENSSINIGAVVSSS